MQKVFNSRLPTGVKVAALPGGAEFGFVRQQVVAKVVARGEELLDVAAQCSHGACGFLRSGGVALPAPSSFGRSFLFVRVSAFRKRLSVVPLPSRAGVAAKVISFLHKYFLLK